MRGPDTRGPPPGLACAALARQLQVRPSRSLLPRSAMSDGAMSDACGRGCRYPQQLLAEEECDGFVADFFAHLQQSLQREAAATEGGDAGQGSATDSGGQPEEFS